MTFVDCRAVLESELTADSDAALRAAEDSGSEDGGGGARRVDLAKVKAACAELGLRRLSATPVVHCAHSFALTLESVPKKGEEGEMVPGWKLVWSGDTRPCPALTATAADATVLIHEATFENGMIEDAMKKRHSMTSEAVQTGLDARAYRTILTHFSQRYPKVPVFDETYTARTAIAFDSMRVDFKSLPRLPSLLPAVRDLFEDIQAEEEAAIGVEGDAA